MDVKYYLPVGSILKVDLKLNCDHSGIYLGYGNVAELDGSGKIMVRYLDDFLKGDRSMRCGDKIFAAYDRQKQEFLADDQFALRAIESLCQIRQYDVTNENCHKFTTGCITGNFDNHVTFFSELESKIQNHFHITVTDFEWKNLGLFFLIPNKLKNLKDFQCRNNFLGNDFSCGLKILKNFLIYHDFIDDSYSNPEASGRMLIYLLDCMQQGFPNTGEDVRRFLFNKIPDILDDFIGQKIFKTVFLEKILSYAKNTSFEELRNIRNIESLIQLMARAGILLQKTNSIYSISKIDSIVNSFNSDQSMVDFSFFLEDELKCNDLPMEAFVSNDGTVAGLFNAMQCHLPTEIFKKIFTWNDPVFE